MKDKHTMIYVASEKKDTNELICRTKTEQNRLGKNYLYQRGQVGGGGGGGLGVWDWRMHTEVCGMIGQCGPAV